MSDHLSKSEIRKDAVQGTVEAAASTVGQVTTILTGAVRDVAVALGGFATEVFEIRDSARKASREHEVAGRDVQDGQDAQPSSRPFLGDPPFELGAAETEVRRRLCAVCAAVDAHEHVGEERGHSASPGLVAAGCVFTLADRGSPFKSSRVATLLCPAARQP